MWNVCREKENQEQRQSSDSERKIQLLEYRKKMEADVKRLQKTHDSKVQAILEKYGLLLEKVRKTTKSALFLALHVNLYMNDSIVVLILNLGVVYISFYCHLYTDSGSLL